MSVDGSLQLAYNGGLSAALTLLLAHGLKTTSGSGHHETAFAAAQALGYDGLEDLVVDSMEVRSLRAGSVYDPVIASEADRERALEWMRRLLPAVRKALVEKDPGLSSWLEEASP